MKRISRGELLLIVVSIAFCLLLGELAVRSLNRAWPFDRAVVMPSYMAPSEAALRWRFSPRGARNSLGLSNPEIGAKRAGAYRILFLGDSLVYDARTRSDRRYTRAIADRLNEAEETGKFEVINAGIPGYTTYQEFEFLKLHGIDMAPDLVILGFVFNDLYYRYYHRPTGTQLLDFEPSAVLHRFDTSRFPGSLFARSFLAHEIYAGLERITKKIDRTIDPENGHPWYPFEFRSDFYLAWKPHGWRHTEPLIREMKMVVQAKKSRLMVVIFPVVTQVDDRYRRKKLDYLLYPQRRIREILERNGIPYLDMTEPLHDGGGPKLFRDYLHLNEAGNDIVADRVASYLLEAGRFW